MTAHTENFPVHNRYSSQIQFTAEIKCEPDALPYVKLGLAVRWARDNGADLTGAYLGGGDGGAYLRGDKLSRLLACATRSDGYEFFAFEIESGGFKIRAGCRWFSLSEYRAHIKAEYPDTDKATETTAILDFLAKRAKQQGVSLKAPKKTEAA